ncbi:MAG: hypothetical protein WDN28_09215 [Chthoniobacter sp.]
MQIPLADAPRSPAVLFGVAAIVLAYACLLLKPSWYFGAATTSLPVVIGLFGKAVPRPVRLATPVLGLVAALLLLWLPARGFVIRDGASVTLLPDALFCVHAEFIQRYLDAKLAKMPASDPDKAKLQTLLDVLKSELYNAGHDRKVYEKLRFDADYLMHSPVLSAALDTYAGHDRGKFSRFCFAATGMPCSSIRSAIPGKSWISSRTSCFPSRRLFSSTRSTSRKPTATPRPCGSPETSRLCGPTCATCICATAKTWRPTAARRRCSASTPALNVLKELVSRSALAVGIALRARPCSPPWSGRPCTGCAWEAGRRSFSSWRRRATPSGSASVHTLDIYRYRVTYGGYLLFTLTAMAVFVCIVAAQAPGSRDRQPARAPGLVT